MWGSSFSLQWVKVHFLISYLILCFISLGTSQKAFFTLIRCSLIMNFQDRNKFWQNKMFSWVGSSILIEAWYRFLLLIKFHSLDHIHFGLWKMGIFSTLTISCCCFSLEYLWVYPKLSTHWVYYITIWIHWYIENFSTWRHISVGMPPTSKKLEEHIASVCPSVCHTFL